GVELALGDKPYVSDLAMPGLLEGACRFSDHPRARLVRISTSRATAIPGVLAVLTWRDVPGERRQGVITRDWRQFVAEGEISSYVGDVIAVVVARNRHAARVAAELVDVEYEVLKPVISPDEALRPGAPRLHENRKRRCVSRVGAG